MKMLTVGSTRKTAQQFFSALRLAGVRRVIDVRPCNQSRLAGFTRKADLPYLLRSIAQIEYFALRS